MQADWELSHAFVSDGLGIRCACVLPAANDATSYRLVAGTQGGSMWEFEVPSGNMRQIEYQHNHAVTALLSNSKVYVTGCKDNVVRVFGHDHNLVATLKGHEKAVTSLAWVGESFLVTGSWDGTAKVWNIDTKALVTTLKDHENTVSVCGLGVDNDDSSILKIATGSAGIAQNNAVTNHTTRIWSVNPTTGDQKLLHTVANDHDGPIRDLTISAAGMLATCSNDGTVKLRSVETGEALSTLTVLAQDAPILLSVTAIGEMLAASAEDGNVILWSGEESQFIQHPSCVWNVLAVPENDLATCCQDGTLRIFTQSTDRRAEQSVLDEFTKTVQEAMDKQKKGPSQDEVAKLPKWELNALQQGKSEGQVQLFQKDGKAIAAQWSATSRTWIEVGEVVGSNENAGIIDGVQYDHVLPIEVDQEGGGVAKLNIGYNTGENPFVAAQRFIDQHVLPQYHLSDIADYIQQRTGKAGPTLGMDSSGPQTHVPAASYEHLPMVGYKSFELTKGTSFAKMEAKLKEPNKLSESELESLQTLMATLGATNRYHASKVTPKELKVVQKILAEWPAAQAFPALDLSRLAVLHPDAASDGFYWNQTLQLALRQCEKVADADGTAAVAVPMLSLRLFANAFKGGSGALQAVVDNLDSVLSCTESHIKSANKNVRLSVATVLLNVASYLHSNSDPKDISPLVVAQVNSILDTKQYESEAMVRTLVALGTVLLKSSSAKEAAKSLYMVSKVEMMASPHGEKAKATAKEIYSILNT